MRSLYEDLRYGFCVLRVTPGFTAVAVLTLALGIGVNTTVFSWINSVWLNPLPGVQTAHELAAFESTAPNVEYQSTSFPDFRDFRDNLKQVSGLAATFLTPLRVGEGERAQRVWGELVSGNFFDVLGAKPLIGRFFAPEDLLSGRCPPPPNRPTLHRRNSATPAVRPPSRFSAIASGTASFNPTPPCSAGRCWSTAAA